jgi:ribosomal protein L12E/L44/L45/RPP1/RPP2
VILHVPIIHVAFSNASRLSRPSQFPQEECSTMTLTSRLAVVALASLLATGTAFAQTAAPAAKTDTKTTTAAPMDKKAPKEHSAESLECSKQADAKGLHGKERKKFRSECIKTAKAGMAAPAAEKK